MRLRTRLSLAFLLTLTTTGLVSALVGAWIIGVVAAEQAQQEARHNLASARVLFEGARDQLGQQLRLAALDDTLRQAADLPHSAGLAQQLERLRVREQLDGLTLLSPDGVVLQRAHHAGARGDSLADQAVVAAVIEGQAEAATPAAASAQQLSREDEQLAQRACRTVSSAQRASSSGVDEPACGLVLEAAAALPSADGHPAGILYGFKLLNGDTALVDRIRATVYRGERYQGREVGEGTLCLADVRVATNATLGDGSRALGTRVDPAVREQVLEQGEPWIDRASVLGEDHIAAYEPIRDLTGNVLGILCVGIPEARYTEVRNAAWVPFFGITLAGLLVALLIAGAQAQSVTRPIHRLVDTVQQLARGHLDRRVAPDPSIEEVRLLGLGINDMAAGLQERDAELQARTTAQLSRSDRLAVIGRLAAGVAHEINNPLGGIMLFTGLLMRKVDAHDPSRANLERIDHEARRCQKIVRGLLDFSRQREPTVERIHIHEVLEQTLDLVEEQAMFQNLTLLRSLSEQDLVIQADRGQIQQVLINLVMNAAEAMDGEGTLTIRTALVGDPQTVELEVRDTGRGISKEDLARIFDPFFTTKGVGEGTGLGLSISRSIIENHHGTIDIQTRPGAGSSFTLRFPAAPRDET